MIAGRGVVFVLAGFAVLLAAVAASSVWSGATHLTRDDTSTDVEHAARRFVETFGMFESTSAGGYRERLVALTAHPLRGELAAAVVEPAALSQRRSLRTDIERVSVTALSEGDAGVIVTTRQTRRWIDSASGAAVAETVSQRIALVLVREGERWLVNDVQVLADAPASD